MFTDLCTIDSSDKLCSLYKLEYLAVYGRASMAAFRQLSTHVCVCLIVFK